MAASTSAINASLLLLFAFSLAPTRSEAPAEEVLVSSVETAPIPRGWGTSTAAASLYHLPPFGQFKLSHSSQFVLDLQYCIDLGI